MTPEENARSQRILRESKADDADAARWAEVFAAMVATVTVRDREPKTFEHIESVATTADRWRVQETLRQIDSGELQLPEQYRMLRGAICDAREGLRGGGIDLSTDERQQFVAIVGGLGGWSAELTAAVMSLGLRTLTVQEIDGDPAATEGDYALAWRAFRTSQRIDNAAAIAHEMVDPNADPETQAAQWRAAWDQSGQGVVVSVDLGI